MVYYLIDCLIKIAKYLNKLSLLFEGTCVRDLLHCHKFYRTKGV